MNILKKTIGVLAVSAMCTTSVFADSSAFRGIYVGVGAAINGIALDGTYKDPTVQEGSTAANSKGSVGKVEPSAHGEIGYNLALGSAFFMSIGASLTPVDATISGRNVKDSKLVTLELSDLESYYVEPSVMITDNTALFFKYAIVEGDFTAKGNDLGAAKVSALEGDTMAIGTKIVTDGGFYVKAEAGITSFDTIKITNITDEATTALATSQIEAELGYGAVTVGFIF